MLDNKAASKSPEQYNDSLQSKTHTGEARAAPEEAWATAADVSSSGPASVDIAAALTSPSLYCNPLRNLLGKDDEKADW